MGEGTEAGRRPFVSILTPCLNNRRFIEPCIQSVLRQDYRPIEHIIQDGGSTDGTLDVLRSYGGLVNWRSEKDAGQSDGLNRALQRCQGDIIGVLNSDDEYLPDAVSWAVERMRRHPEAAVVYADQHNIDDGGRVLSTSRGPARYDYKRIFCCDDIIPAQAAFIRRRALETVGFYVDVTRTTCPDYEMWVRLGLRYPMNYESRVVARYRLHESSEGQNPDTVLKMVHSKLGVVNRTCGDPATPAAVRRLKRTAHRGVYYWSACHLSMIRQKGVRAKVSRQLWKSLLVCPNLRSLEALFTVNIFFTLPDWKEALRVTVRRIRETGRFVDRVLFFGLVYRLVYLPLKRLLKGRGCADSSLSR